MVQVAVHGISLGVDKGLEAHGLSIVHQTDTLVPAQCPDTGVLRGFLDLDFLVKSVMAIVDISYLFIIVVYLGFLKIIGNIGRSLEFFPFLASFFKGIVYGP